VTDKIETIEIHGESSVDWKATAFRYIELNRQKTETIQRVRELHKQVTQDNAACGDIDCCGEYEESEECADCQCEYPCPTIRALDGDVATLERDDDHDSRREYFRDEDLG